MGLLTPVLERTNVTEIEDRPTDDRPSRTGLARKAIVALAAGAAAYLVVRRVREPLVRRVRDGRPAVDDLPEIVEDATPIDGERIPIGEPGGERGEDAEDGSESGAKAGDDAADQIDGATGNLDTADVGGADVDDRSGSDAIQDEPRSSAEITERAEENVQAEPAEPGEMTVGEDVVDDLVDEPDAETEGARPEGGEADEGGPEGREGGPEGREATEGRSEGREAVEGGSKKDEPEGGKAEQGEREDGDERAE